MDLLLKPERIKEFKQLVWVAVLNDPSEFEGTTASEINSARDSLSDLAQLNSLARLAEFRGLSELNGFSELSVLSELKGK